MNDNDGKEVYELYVEKGQDPDDPSRSCPISRLPNGKRALFKREHWQMVRLGDTWEVYVDLDSQNYAMVHPVRKLSSETDGQVSLEAQDILVALAQEEISKITSRMEVISEDVLPLQEQYQHLESEAKTLMARLVPLQTEATQLKAKKDKLELAVREMTGGN